ncbi:MAG: DUF4350 domain-containing protein [Anaerolineales bacterium]
MKIDRNTLITLVLILLLLLITTLAAVQQARMARDEGPPLSPISSAPGGGRALWLWLQGMGRSLSADPQHFFQASQSVDLVLILEPQYVITPEEWKIFDRWIEEGGTLVLAGSAPPMLDAAQHYGFDLTYTERRVEHAAPVSPLWAAPPLPVTVTVRSNAVLSPVRTDYLPHLATETHPVLVSLERGAGRVILSASAYPFSNAGLKEVGSGALILNILTAAPRSERIWFDEWHHGVRASSGGAGGPLDALRSTPPGWALLYAAGVVFVALLLRGKAFGRPLRPPRATLRRAPLEYVTAIANLRRRAGHRSAELAYYRQWLKRELGRRYRLDPLLHDGLYVARLAEYEPGLDREALRSLLARLRQSDVEEDELVALAMEVTQWLEEKR